MYWFNGKMDLTIVTDYEIILECNNGEISLKLSFNNILYNMQEL